MEDLRTLIPEEEKVLLHDYIKTYMQSDSCTHVDDIDHLLRFWTENKKPLFKLLGDNLIIKENIKYEASSDDLEGRIDDLFDDIYCDVNLINVKKFIHDFDEIIYVWYDDLKRGKLTEEEYDKAYKARMLIEHCLEKTSLVLNKNWYSNNSSSMNTVVIDRGPHAKNHKPLVLKGDMKLMRMIAKLVDWFELDKDAFEQFRILHSRILNDKTLEGNAVLSIHPLDYLTMSDNNCDWDSCMRWWDPGDYRLGTIEMMNSPVVVEAYLESAHPFYPIYTGDTRTWSNKKWRCLYIVNKDIITEIKQYPYYNAALSIYFMDKLKTLAETNLGWHYGNLDYVAQKEHNKTSVGEVYIAMYTHVMYNDYYDNHWAYINPEVNKVKLCYSGETECMSCGEAYEANSDGCSNFVNTDKVVCAKCENFVQCDECGTWVDADDAYYDPNGIPYCNWCADGRTATCSCCGERKWLDYDFKKQALPYMFIVKTPNGKHQRDVKGPFDICDDCYEDYDFDDVPKEMDTWGDYQYIDIDKVDEKVWRPFILYKGAIIAAKKKLKEICPDDYV